MPKRKSLLLVVLLVTTWFFHGWFGMETAMLFASNGNNTAGFDDEFCIAGNLLIPGYPNDKIYKAVMKISPSKKQITIVCKKRIFSLINDFDFPRKNTLIMPLEEIDDFWLERNMIYLFPGENLLNMHKNLFFTLIDRRKSFLFPTRVESMIFERGAAAPEKSIERVFNKAFRR